MINGQPVVFLYSAAFAVAHDQSCIDYVRQSFARDFGGRVPYIVREVSWRVQSENVYAWGGALGLKNPGVASLGPGYNDSAVPGRTPLIVNRESGALFERNWTRFLWNPSRIVAIETWNEYHESTDIAASREYGRAYIELNRKYADLFKSGVRLPLPRGPYSDVRFVSAGLGATNTEYGLDHFELADGTTVATNVAGSVCRSVAPNPSGGRYVYFRIDDSFKWAASMQAEVQVDFFDSAHGNFAIEFDGSDTNAPFNGAYTRSPVTAYLGGSLVWRTARFNLSGAQFMHSQNGGADFRLASSDDPFFVRRVKVIRPGVPEEAGQEVNGCLEDFASPLGTHWTNVGTGVDRFQQTNGVLRILSSPSGFNQLLLLAGDATATTQELLVRLRVTRLAAGDALPGGIAVAAETNNQSGFSYLFRAAQSGRQTGLRHEPNSLSGLPDLWAKTWRADGLTPEPSGWLVVWDYYPAQPLHAGFPGLVSSADGGASEMECDFFLVKASDLPSITVALPAQKPAQAGLFAGHPLSSGAIPVQLTGETVRSYEIQASTNLADWIGLGVVPLSNSPAEYLDTTATNFDRRFYRARLLP
jgi:hypothetical protein